MTVRFSLAAQMLMRRRGMDPRRVHTLIAGRHHQDGAVCVDPKCQHPHTINEESVQNSLKAFSCMVVENYLDLSDPTKVDLSCAPSVDYWAATIDSDKFVEVELAIWQALGKALEARRAKLQAVAPPSSLAS